MPRRSSNGIPYYVGLAVIVVTVLFAAAMAWNYVAPGLGLSSIPIPDTEKPTTTTSETVAVNKPLKITLIDELGGGGIPSASINIMDSAGVTQEILTTSTDGSITTSMAYPSGTQIILKPTATNYVTSYFPKTVPKMSTLDAETASVNPMVIKIVKTPLPVITVLDSFGQLVANGGSITLNSTNPSATLTVTVSNMLDNSGWKTSYDPLNKVNLGIAAVSSVTDGVMTGSGSVVSRAGETYLVTSIPDSAICKQKVGNDYPQYKGVYSYGLTINRGSVTNGSFSATINVYGNFDQGYFTTYGIGSPNQTLLATFAIAVNVS